MSLSHIDLTDPDNFLAGTPHEWLREIRNEDPVHWHEGSNGAFWCVTKWDDLRTVSRNPKLYSSARRGTNMPNRELEERMAAELKATGGEDPQAAMAANFPIMLMMDPLQGRTDPDCYWNAAGASEHSGAPGGGCLGQHPGAGRAIPPPSVDCSGG